MIIRVLSFTGLQLSPEHLLYQTGNNKHKKLVCFIRNFDVHDDG